MSRPLRILLVNKAYPPHIGGIETLVRQYARYFQTQFSAEVQVLVCQEKGKTARGNHRGCSSAASRKYWDVFFLSALRFVSPLFSEVCQTSGCGDDSYAVSFGRFGVLAFRLSGTGRAGMA